MKKRTLIDQREENIKLIKLYSNYLPFCDTIPKRVKIAQEIVRLSNINQAINETPLSECLKADQLFTIRKSSKFNQLLQIAG